MNEEQTVDLPTNRSFGILFTLIFALISVWNYLSDQMNIAMVSLGLTVACVLTTFAFPQSLSPLNRAWMKLGLFLGKLVNPVILGVIFFLIITPVSLITRLAGRDALRLNQEHHKTYWRTRDNNRSQTDSFKNQF